MVQLGCLVGFLWMIHVVNCQPTQCVASCIPGGEKCNSEMTTDAGIDNMITSNIVEDVS